MSPDPLNGGLSPADKLNVMWAALEMLARHQRAKLARGALPAGPQWPIVLCISCQIDSEPETLLAHGHVYTSPQFHRGVEVGRWEHLEYVVEDTR